VVLFQSRRSAGQWPTRCLSLAGLRAVAPRQRTLQEAQSCTNFLSSFSLLLSYLIPLSVQLEFTPIAKTETSYNLNRELSLVFSSVLTMAKIQAQKRQHTGKALTLQTRTQIKRCSVHLWNYSTPLDLGSILKRWFRLSVTLAAVITAQRIQTQGIVLWPKEKKMGWHPWRTEGKKWSPNIK